MRGDLMAGVEDIDKGWEKIKKSVELECVALVGVQSDGEERDDGSVQNIDLAMIHEFGSPDAKIPERSFIRSSFDNHIHEYSRMLQVGAGKIIDGDMSMEQVVGVLGEKVLSDIKTGMDEGIPPPLKYREGTPLVDTAQLKNSLQVKIGEPEEDA